MTNLGSVDAGGAYEVELRAAAVALDRLVRRLRHSSTAAWRTHRSTVDALVRELVDLSCAVEHIEDLPVPRLPDHALPDAVMVIGTDVLVAIENNQDWPSLRTFSAVIGTALDASR